MTLKDSSGYLLCGCCATRLDFLRKHGASPHGQLIANMVRNGELEATDEEKRVAEEICILYLPKDPLAKRIQRKS